MKVHKGLFVATALMGAMVAAPASAGDWGSWGSWDGGLQQRQMPIKPPTMPKLPRQQKPKDVWCMALHCSPWGLSPDQWKLIRDKIERIHRQEMPPEELVLMPEPKTGTPGMPSMPKPEDGFGRPAIGVGAAAMPGVPRVGMGGAIAIAQ